MALGPRHLPWLLAPLAVAALAVPLMGSGSSGAGNGTTASTTAGVPAAMATLANRPASLQQEFVALVSRVSPSVVQIRTEQALGSGVVFDGRGDVVTNAHVVAGASHVVVTLASGERHPATVVGRDVGHDLAVIRLAAGRPPAATFADSSQLQVGDIALALGNPLGLRSSVTQGIVSAVGRRVSESNGVALSTIQTSAEINPGNSGGALVDLSGRVIGIPTLAAVDPEMGGGQAPGIGFAIDSNTVRRVAGALAGAR
ncbi:MAG: S1C family serine protease [Thermoleophilaceae bacterium]